MPRQPRIIPDNSVQHVINRGNKREQIFFEPADYEDFFCLLAEAQRRVPMRILVICVMRNHFHLVAWVEQGVALSAFMHWLMSAQISRHKKRHGTTGLGHVYQGRFKNFMVQDDAHLFRVLRYVEANPVRAGLVDRAQDYPWSSLSRRVTPDGRRYLAEWPTARPQNWCDYVNTGIDQGELDALRFCARRGAPYGDEPWVSTAVETYGLGHTIRKPGQRL